MPGPTSARRRRFIATAPLTLAVALGLAGCASTAQGRKFDDSYVAQIQKGKTTKAQIRQNFGEPVSTSRSADLETWTYSYSDAYGRGYVQAATFGLVRQKSDDQTLIVVFKGDVVVEFTYTK
jgi:outer membrane protein assembly factor BamE (lipoprotein component of BamABCDE complex)